MRMSDWMASIGDGQRLCDITMPGSHDSGVYQDVAVTTGLGRKAGAVCQSVGLGGQCSAGSRFFDLRVLTHKGNQVAHHSQKVGPMRHGAFGGDLTQMMGELVGFLRANPSEFVIARFTKCKDHQDIVATVKRVGANFLYKGRACFARQNVGDLRGRIIAVFGDDFTAHIDPAQGIHAFMRYEGQQHHHNGLTTCGKYANDMDMRKVVLNQIAKLDEHDTHKATNHLCVMYWTQTSGIKNIRKFTTAKDGAHAHVQDIRAPIRDARSVRKNQGLPPPLPANVVMYDFVNDATSKIIVGLNFPPYA